MEDNKLSVQDSKAIASDLSLDHPSDQTIENLEDKATKLTSTLLGFKNDDINHKDDLKEAVEQMGMPIQKKAASQSRMLEQPIKEMGNRSADGGEVANALIDLKMKVEELDPAQADFEAGFLTRIMGYLPGVGTPLKRYFSKFESAQTVISAIIKSLESGRDRLVRDNKTLAEDQKQMRQVCLKLEQSVKLGQLLDEKITYQLERELQDDANKKKFVEEEILFAVRQRIMDLQQQYAVNQQGVLASEIVIRNNKELIRGVNRALNVTVSALQVAVTVALALENQKIVLTKVNALNQATDSILANTASRLKTQGVEIQKQAASGQLNLDTLKKAFEDINTAMDDISTFRQKALPQMAQSVIEMEALTKKSEESIKRMELSKRAEPKIMIDAEIDSE